MATKTPKRVFDTHVYKRPPGQAMPRPIENEKELARVQSEVDKLTSKPEDRLSPEESALLDILSLLLEQYEHVHHPIPEAPGNVVLKMLMDEHELKEADLVSVFRSRAAISRVLSGSRAISNAQAKKLAEFFHVSVYLFI